MIVLGFDPGTANTGWGVIEQEGNRLRSLGHGCIVTSAKDPTHVRLRQIYDQARGLIKRFCPDVVVLEELFVNVNVKTALAVGQAKGVLYLAASELDESPCEYSPLADQAGGHRLRAGEQDPGAGDDQGHPLPAAHPAAGPRRRRPRGRHLPHAPQQRRHARRARPVGRAAAVIASVRGKLLMVDGERAVIEVGGLGLEVLASSRTLGSLSPHRGEEVSLTTYLNVREDALQLFGFRDLGERTFFLWLTAVSGVGPKVALAVLSGYPVAELELAVARDDVKKFESIPGIGKKLAQRLVVELKDKVGELPPVAAGEAGETGGPAHDAFIAGALRAAEPRAHAARGRGGAARRSRGRAARGPGQVRADAQGG